MTHVAPAPARPSTLGQLLQILRAATLERMVLPDIDGMEIDERILLESHLVQTPPVMLAAPKPPLL